MTAQALRAPRWCELVVLLAAETRCVPLRPALPSMNVYSKEAQGIFSGQRALWARAWALGPTGGKCFNIFLRCRSCACRWGGGGRAWTGRLLGHHIKWVRVYTHTCVYIYIYIYAKDFYRGHTRSKYLYLLSDIKINDLGNSKKLEIN